MSIKGAQGLNEDVITDPYHKLNPCAALVNFQMQLKGEQNYE